MLGSSWPPKDQTSVPSGLVTSFGARSAQRGSRWPSNTSGGSTTWSSTLTRTRSSTFMSVPPAGLRRPTSAPEAEDPHRVAGEDALALVGRQVGHGVVDDLAGVGPVVPVVRVVGRPHHVVDPDAV